MAPTGSLITLVALELMIAESEPEEMEMTVKLVVDLIDIETEVIIQQPIGLIGKQVWNSLKCKLLAA
ncbi:hypothetical protein LQ567_11050 [Niabella pedocola]|uniref:Uncharacterized protein n=1 Tax=Niabella pedocola TaxID=1752077 RepID=A0ABS8PQD8_9BACT|nr:hypothetical protein [Niabella pedocola]MCD2423299.1 hypothetical protein [Niabella pedocola]